MIFSTIADYKNAHLPKNIELALEEALPFLKNIPEVGEYMLSNNAKAMVGTYNTRPEEELPYESHEVMTDIHIVLDGEEYLKVRPSNDLTKMSDPQEIKNFREDLPIDVFDLQFYKEQPKEHALMHLGQENFCIIFPHEAHAAGIQIVESKQIIKMVVKIPNK